MNMKTIAFVAFSAATFFASATALAQTCPAGFPNDCGTGRCCPSGYACGGTCGSECCPYGGGSSSSSGGSSGSSGSSGGRFCPVGEVQCGVSHCVPEGDECCASVGHEELSCNPGLVCSASGGCEYATGTSSSSSGYSSSGYSSSGYSSSGYSSSSSGESDPGPVYTPSSCSIRMARGGDATLSLAGLGTLAALALVVRRRRSQGGAS